MYDHCKNHRHDQCTDHMFFIACGVEAYFPAAYNLKAFVFGLAFYQLMGLFKGKEKEEKRGKAVNASE